MTGAPLDVADEALLAALSQDGRASLETLARVTGLHRSTVRARTARLLTEVVDVLGIVHPTVFGLDAYALLLVEPAGPALATAQALAARAEVPFVSVVSGAVGVVAEVRAADQRGVAAVVADLAALPAVAGIETCSYVDILTDAAVPPRPAGPVAVDAIDRSLLARLQVDGRLSFAALAEAVGLSVGATRMRVLRLREEGVLHIGVRLRPAAVGVLQAGAALTVRGDLPAVLDAIGRRPRVTYLASALGRWSVICTVRADSPAGLADELDALRQVPGVSGLRSWTHLRLVKERYQDGAG
ncbi:Lrp/AsnC family transcriptional regulator [Nakamurella flavida]|uniref:Lrp/AsnC family transcriptional regulator n=1 Tax=Nakamurella flavida TaxID=363630 RepID=A0A938YKC9_9ACTN|nr:AsnC family transcriptional regulator [Nakamurella flavida]MBM9476298.1 Lrp/AsnC family transcriptional regulator [Nakamurella flavida]MDP9779602.1 DNA-binding Lrp family transcriptional regulator [Nakamurella flavida]